MELSRACEFLTAYSLNRLRDSNATGDINRSWKLFDEYIELKVPLEHERMRRACLFLEGTKIGGICFIIQHVRNHHFAVFCTPIRHFLCYFQKIEGPAKRELGTVIITQELETLPTMIERASSVGLGPELKVTNK